MIRVWLDRNSYHLGSIHTNHGTWPMFTDCGHGPWTWASFFTSEHGLSMARVQWWCVQALVNVAYVHRPCRKSIVVQCFFPTRATLLSFHLLVMHRLKSAQLWNGTNHWCGSTPGCGPHFCWTDCPGQNLDSTGLHLQSWGVLVFHGTPIQTLWTLDCDSPPLVVLACHIFCWTKKIIFST